MLLIYFLPRYVTLEPFQLFFKTSILISMQRIQNSIIQKTFKERRLDLLIFQRLVKSVKLQL